MCGFFLWGPHVFPGYNEAYIHVSLQAFVMDLVRWRMLLPLQLDRPQHHIEKLIMQAGRREGRLHMMFMTPQHLGVAKTAVPPPHGHIASGQEDRTRMHRR